jgi:probable HAF family extracellular repeat protein
MQWRLQFASFIASRRFARSEICKLRTMSSRWLIAMAACAAFATIAPSHDAQAASLIPVGFVPFQQSVSVNGVSADGSVVTGYFLSGGPTEAVSWTAGTLTVLGFLPSPYNGASQGTAANSNGSIVAGYSGPYARPDEAFRWVGGTMTGLGFLGGGNSSAAYGISADGSVVVGIATSTAFGDGQAFSWANGTMTSLVCPEINNAQIDQCGATAVSADGSVVVGNSSDSGSLLNHAIRWIGGSPTSIGNPCPTCEISATAVNSDGAVMVGDARFTSNGPISAYRWVNGTTTALGQLPGGNSSHALGVSADGSVVVGYGGSGNGQAFIWTATTGMQLLSDVLAGLGVNLSGWGLGAATGISADGTVIVGTGDYGNQGTGWIAYLRGGPSFTATPTSGESPLAVTFHASGLSLPLTYTINFGDSTTGPVTQSSCISDRPVAGSSQGVIQCSGTGSHTYQNSGSHTATLLGASGGMLGTVTIVVGKNVARPHLSSTANPPPASAPVTVPPPMPERHSLDQ